MKFYSPLNSSSPWYGWFDVLSIMDEVEWVVKFKAN